VLDWIVFLTSIFKYFGLQTLIENIIRSQEIKVFTRTMRQLVCMMDEWDGLTMDDIRRMEDEAKQKLDEMIKSEEKKDM
jgi:phosphatidylinositol transfer protein alpha isoform